ncbi:hypothetical protein FJZ18_04555 [Candidatus Pacearchaeota archaeon]|nr:hypothetical protein [Candidatus Pacearchaeota archaeon]
MGQKNSRIKKQACPIYLVIIKKIGAKQIRDSRGQLTIEVEINGFKSSAPSGKSTGKYETPTYNKSLEWNIRAINGIKSFPEIVSFKSLKKIENHLSSIFKLRSPLQFGANALFALESAILKALAKEQKKDLWQLINPRAKRIPVPVGNAVGGGIHSTAFKYHTVVQEFLIIPQKSSVGDNVALMEKIHLALKTKLGSKKTNDEGAWQTSLDEEGVLQLLSAFKGVRLGIDVAASTFYHGGKFHYQDKTLSSDEQIDYIEGLKKKYNLLYIEDPFNEEDFKSFSKIKHDSRHLIVGDDLTATHITRIKKALRLNSINGVIVKPNQNGSLLALQEIFDFCKKNKIKTILSHRSGETMDDAIADYAFGFQADYIKCGIATKWRQAKLNRLVDIEKNLE